MSNLITSLNRTLNAIGNSFVSLSLHKKKIGVGLVTFILSTASFNTAAVHAASSKAFLVPIQKTTTPPGARNMCRKYSWACKTTTAQKLDTKSTLRIARKINNLVNQRVRQIDDSVQYGKAEYWTLPSSRGGDCEDIVLLKKKKLIESGVPSGKLLIATVLDRNRNSHAVLVLRTSSGDLVLDSQQKQIKPWRNTGYTFLKMQNPKSMRKWDAVLAGGLIKDSPTASH